MYTYMYVHMYMYMPIFPCALLFGSSLFAVTLGRMPHDGVNPQRHFQMQMYGPLFQQVASPSCALVAHWCLTAGLLVAR